LAGPDLAGLRAFRFVLDGDARTAFCTTNIADNGLPFRIIRDALIKLAIIFEATAPPSEHSWLAPDWLHPTALPIRSDPL
jgi:hypothetical protein